MRWVLALLSIAAAACGSAGPASAPARAVVSGTVVAAPCRPVERSGDPPCPPAAGVVVDFGSERATTDAAGRYSVRLAPGTYSIAVTSGSMRRPGRPDRFTVTTAEPVSLDLTFDSGIR